jgi:hypothetical protein
MSYRAEDGCAKGRVRARRIELKPAKRIDRRDLVDDQHLAAEPDDAREFGDDELWPRNVVQRATDAARSSDPSSNGRFATSSRRT